MDVVGGRAVLVVRIGARRVAGPAGVVRQTPGVPVGVCRCGRGIRHHASLALEAVMERDNLNRSVAARHRVGPHEF